MVSPFRSLWDLDPEVTFLNHGSFGAAPRAVLEEQSRLRARLEAEPVRFFVREYLERLDAAREELARFAGADPDCLAFVPNATTAISDVLGSLDFEAGDELLVTDQEYNASRNALDRCAERSGARVVVAPVPFPLGDGADFERALLARAGARTRLVLVDHVTSATGLVLPLEGLLAAFRARGVPVLVDGAHAVGMLPLELGRLDPDYYTSNCHKWLCAPKGAAFLYVRRELRDALRPCVTSHGANTPPGARSRFRHEFDWRGTLDPTPWLCVPFAIAHLGGAVPGGWPEIRRRNRELALAARALLCERLAIAEPAPAACIGSLAALPLPDGPAAPPSPLYVDPLQDRLWHEHRIEVPISPWPRAGKRVLRVSAQLYNELADYERLAGALAAALAEESRD